jgi:head-tail adaptor
MPINFTPAGALIFRITIQERVRSQTALGTMVDSWTDLFQVPADIAPLKSQNYDASAAHTKGRTRSYLIKTRPMPIDLLPDQHRIMYKGRVFEIFGVENVMELNREWQITAISIVE